jgi:hypothetical protein
MSALDRYRSAKFALSDATHAANKIGAKYAGGGGGTGEIREIVASICIYHQASDGAANYHKDNKPLNAALSRAAMEIGPSLVRRAIELLEADVAAAKQAAADEYRKEFGDIESAP